MHQYPENDWCHLPVLAGNPQTDLGHLHRTEDKAFQSKSKGEAFRERQQGWTAEWHHCFSTTHEEEENNATQRSRWPTYWGEEESQHCLSAYCCLSWKVRGQSGLWPKLWSRSDSLLMISCRGTGILLLVQQAHIAKLIHCTLHISSNRVVAPTWSRNGTGGMWNFYDGCIPFWWAGCRARVLCMLVLTYVILLLWQVSGFTEGRLTAMEEEDISCFWITKKVRSLKHRNLDVENKGLWT